MSIDAAMRLEGVGNFMVFVSLLGGAGSVATMFQIGKFTQVVAWGLVASAAVAALGLIFGWMGWRAHVRALAQERRKNLPAGE